MEPFYNAQSVREDTSSNMRIVRQYAAAGASSLLGPAENLPATLFQRRDSITQWYRPLDSDDEYVHPSFHLYDSLFE